MRYLLTLMFVLGIYWSYQSITEYADSDVELPENKIEFQAYDTSLEKLQKNSHYESISKQPLFDEKRVAEVKKVKKKTVVKKRVVDNLKVKALGIALTSDGVLAVIKDLKNGKTVRLRINEEIYGWTLKGVSQTDFTFSRGDKEKVINFKNDRG